MSPLASRAAQLLDAQGALAPAWPHWRVRPGQIEMASAVADTLTDGGVLVLEAGTGVGKTLGYLVPLLLAGQRAIVSTATHDLQDQLVRRDIPALRQALGLPVNVVALKGRSSYVCLHRTQQALQRAPRPGEVDQHARLHDVWRWAETSPDGDLAAHGAIDASSALWPRVTSTRENCLGADCPRQRDCHVDRARSAAAQAEWVVINHHVFFADLVLREAGAPSLLPAAQTIVFDEAHGLNDLGVAHLARAVGTRDLQLQTADGTPWPVGNVRLTHQLPGRGRPPESEFSADRMELAALHEVAQHLPLPQAWRTELASARPAGLLSGLRLRWLGPLQNDAVPTEWQARGQIEGPTQVLPATR